MNYIQSFITISILSVIILNVQLFVILVEVNGFTKIKTLSKAFVGFIGMVFNIPVIGLLCYIYIDEPIEMNPLVFTNGIIIIIWSLIMSSANFIVGMCES